MAGSGPSAGRPRGRPRRARAPRSTWRGEFVLALLISALAISLLQPVMDDGAGVPTGATTASADPAPTATSEPEGEGPIDPTTNEPVVFESTGKLEIVPGTEAPSGPEPIRTFTVQIEKGVPIPATEFSGTVMSVLSSPRSWGGLEGFSVQRVDDPNADFHVLLTTPDTTDKLCKPLDTEGIYSCQRENRAILNAMRWLDGAETYGEDLGSYRIYLVNHEVGHVWSHPHVACQTAGTLAPVMVQQTIEVEPCKANPWPLKSEAL